MKSSKSFSYVIFFILITLNSIHAQLPENAKDISPLLISEKLPDANLLNAQGETVQLLTEVSKMKTVLVFYRGGWCPYCNLHLSALATSHEAIVKLGYQIIAVSPDDYRNLKPTTEKDATNYTVYSDPKAELIQAMGIGYSASEKTKNYISKKTIGETTHILPVPALFVLNTEGEILFEYISPNYKQRISSDLLLAVLENLK